MDNFLNPQTVETLRLEKSLLSTPAGGGVLPRLLLYWITTEAVRTKNRRIETWKQPVLFHAGTAAGPCQRGGREAQ